MSKFGKIYVEIDGKLTDISDLERADYEFFLNVIMESIRIAYMIQIKNLPVDKKPDQ